MLGNAIKHYRNKRKLTQQELSDLVGCSVDSIRRWESDIREPRASELFKLCEALRCTETELLNGPRDGKVELTLSWNWEDVKKGAINMEENKFQLILGGDGKIGLQGTALITSMEAIDEFLSQVKEQLTIALDAQVKRGVLPEA